MVEDAHRAYSAAQLQLAQAMAKDLKSEAPLPEPEGDLTYATVSVDLSKEINTALDQRTDIKLARLLVRAANEDERIIAAGYYPSATGSLTADYIPVSGIHREGSTSRNQDFVGSEIREGAAYTWQVVDNGKVGGAVMKARSAKEINELELKKLEANVGQQLSRIRNQLNGIAERHNALISGASNAEQAAVRGPAEFGKRPFVATRIPRGGEQFSENAERIAGGQLFAKCGAGRLGPGHRALFPIFSKICVSSSP